MQMLISLFILHYLFIILKPRSGLIKWSYVGSDFNPALWRLVMYIITLPGESHLLFAEFDKAVHFRAYLDKGTWLKIDHLTVLV